jgi:radical SAM modification target selenobiotic family peptide
MDSQELRKFLAGLGIAGLLAGTSLMAVGCSPKNG